MSFGNTLAIVKARIAEEAERRTGFLDLTGLALEALPKELSGLTALQQLDCNWTQVSDLSPLSGLPALQQLNCSGTEVSDLSPLARLTSLQQLDCSRTAVGDLSPLASLTALRQLDCHRTAVSDLSPLSDLTSLRRLDCHMTEVSDLSPLSGLTGLQELICWRTAVSDLLPLSDLTSLRQLNCSGTAVSDLSPLSGLTGLQQLDCNMMHASDLSPLSGLTALQELNCWGTEVNDLSPLSDLTSLRQLNCSGTAVSDLSPLSGLIALQHLDCSWCRLHTLTSVIREKSALQLIAFSTYVPGLPHGVLSQSPEEDCFAKVQAHFADMAEGATDLVDLKLLLLGNGGVGKTQIARWLAGARFDPEWDSTHGIHIFSQPQPDSIAARLHLHIWDFGGQDIYHGTHAVFLHGPAVLMPVWAKDRENLDTYECGGLTFRNYPLAYWLCVVTHQASRDNPVLIVQNKCDRKEQEERRFPIPEEMLNALNYATELHVSPKEGRGRGVLEETLQDAIAWMRDPKRLGLPQIGSGRLRVQRRLEAMRESDMALPREQRRHRLLERRDFETICSEEGGISSPAMLLDYLNANGTVFYRPGLFSDRIVLDQGWALEAIYAVFDRKRVYTVLLRDEGRFSRAKLGLLVWQEHNDSEQKLLLSMMVSSGICFLHRRFGSPDDDNDEYIAPDLLPGREAVAERLAARWADDYSGETATFHYTLLHGGLIRSIMTEIGEVAGVDALYWRGGLCAFEAGTRSRLLIEEEMSGDWQGMIRVRTQGGQAAALLQKAIAVIERVQARLAMRPVAVKRSSPPAELPDTAKISIVQEKPTMPEWYVSYAWGDDRTAEGRAREEIVDRLCDAAKARGHHILRDKEVLSLGDSISTFMRRIGSGDRVFVILSDKYLRSPHCMFELSEIWRMSRQEGKTFLQRVRIYALPDAKVMNPTDWVDWAIYWKQEHDALESRAQQHGIVVLGDLAHRRLMQMHTFYTQVSDILGTLADIVQPRTFEQLERYGFDELPT